MQEHILEHLDSEGHTGFLENVSVVFIDKTDSQNREKKKKLLKPHLKHYGTLGLKFS